MVVAAASERPEDPRRAQVLELWIRAERITQVGFSYRLRPEDGADLFARLVLLLERRALFASQGGPVRAAHFAGLPEACRLVKERVSRACALFDGDETPGETLARLGIRGAALPVASEKALSYDQDRLAFGEEIVRRGDYLTVPPARPAPYAELGGPCDSLSRRILEAGRSGRLPLTSAHLGPYLPDRDAAVRLFLGWTGEVARAGHLDVLSIGTSQLSQSRFGEDRAGAPDGGGVPLNSAEELVAVWRAARPMLVRACAGTTRVAELAALYEKTIHIAWHALSMWWFCAIDGRGPTSLRENLVQQYDALCVAASSGTPYEANVSHHFAFRGGDDTTYAVSAYLAAKAAKILGVGTFVSQIMLNTPRYTWGTQDLAKARAVLQLLRSLEDGSFRVVVQTRGGLDHLSARPDRAKAQLAAATALMDDIEPSNRASPQIVHVVSYTEGSRLADPAALSESVQLTRHALARYRELRRKGRIDDQSADGQMQERTEEIVAEARAVIEAIERALPAPYTPEGLYRAFAAGFLPAPYLWRCRDELPGAIDWNTRLVRGAVRLTDAAGVPVPTVVRIGRALERLAALPPAPRQGGRRCRP